MKNIIVEKRKLFNFEGAFLGKKLNFRHKKNRYVQNC